MWTLAGKGNQEDMTPSFKLQRRIMAFERVLHAQRKLITEQLLIAREQ